MADSGATYFFTNVYIIEDLLFFKRPEFYKFSLFKTVYFVYIFKDGFLTYFFLSYSGSNFVGLESPIF